MMHLLSLVFLTFMMITSCSRSPYQEEFSIVNKAETVTLFVIDPLPVEKSQQNTSEKYIQNYRVKRTVELADSSQNALRKAILSSDNYIPNNSRGCEFFPVYAIKFGEKMVLLVSSSPCPKVEYHITGKEQIKIVDLIDNSTIEKRLISLTEK